MVSWDGVRSTLQWLFLLLLISVIVAGSAAFHFWSAKDGFVADVLRKKLTEILPDCLIEFEGFRFIDESHIEVTHFTIRSKANAAQLIHVPQIIVEYDTSVLREHRRVVLREVVAQSPEVIFLRDRENRWNWEEFSLLLPPGGASPRWVIKNGTIHVGVRSERNNNIQSTACHGIQAVFQPESHQRYQVQGNGIAEAVGTVNFNGAIDSHTGEWKLAGLAGEIRVGQPLLDLASRFVPEVEHRLADLKASNQELRRLAGREPYPSNLPGRQGALVQMTSSQDSDQSAMRADVAVTFEMGQRRKGDKLDFRVEGLIQNGQLSDQIVPEPLYDLEGKIEISPQRVAITGLKAANGATSLFVDGEANQSFDGWGHRFLVRATQFPIDDRIASVLPPVATRFFDMFQPSGTVDIDIQVEQQPNQSLDLKLQRFAAVNCRVVPDHFRYPIDRIQGQLVQNGKRFEVLMRGEAKGYPVSMTGYIEDADPKAIIDLHISVPEIMIDHDAVNAFSHEELIEIKETLEELQLKGKARDIRANLVRNSQTGHKVMVRFAGQMEEGTLNFVDFPYEITQLSGRITYDPLTRDAVIIEQAVGQHGPATVEAEAVFDMTTEPGVLDLRMAVIGVPVDHDLKAATLTANPELSSIWKDFELGGKIDVEQLIVQWTPETSPNVRLTGIQWRNGSIIPAAFPYRWDDVAGTLHWDGTRLKIHSLSGWHGGPSGTYFELNGSGNVGAQASEAYIEIPPNKSPYWILRFDDLQVMKLHPDDDLRRALPAILRDGIETVDLKGPMDIRLGVYAKGWTPDAEHMSATWKMETTLRQSQLTPGITLKDVAGKITIQEGIWDQNNLRVEGELALDSLRAMGVPLTRVTGPFLVENNRVTLGTPRSGRTGPEYRFQHASPSIEADVYKGVVGLDFQSVVQQNVSTAPYRMEVNVWNVELAEWAADWNFGNNQLMGKIDGNLKAIGQGQSATSLTGDGWVQIMPAAIWELPGIAQIFALPNFSQRKKTAFNYADGEFTVHDGIFDFSEIRMFGETYGFVGKGMVGYAGPAASTLDFNFYSQTPSRLGIFESVKRLVLDNWIRVDVRGTVSHPYAEILPNLGPVETFFKMWQEAASGPPAKDRKRARPTRTLPGN